jgi:hypothetical protein
MSGITKAGSIRQGPGVAGFMATNPQVAWMLAAVGCGAGSRSIGSQQRAGW